MRRKFCKRDEKCVHLRVCLDCGDLTERLTKPGDDPTVVFSDTQKVLDCEALYSKTTFKGPASDDRRDGRGVGDLVKTQYNASDADFYSRSE
jgi:hypothetical protein